MQRGHPPPLRPGLTYAGDKRNILACWFPG